MGTDNQNVSIRLEKKSILITKSSFTFALPLKASFFYLYTLCSNIVPVNCILS